MGCESHTKAGAHRA